MLINDPDNPLSESKASIINGDAESRPNILLIIGTLLAVSSLRSKIKRIIFIVRRTKGKVIYINL